MMGQLIQKYPNNKDVLSCKGPFIHRKHIIYMRNKIIGLTELETIKQRIAV